PKTALAPLNPLPAGGEGRQSIALAGWGSSGLISNQADMISVGIYHNDALFQLQSTRAGVHFQLVLPTPLLQ
ncbi:hypothetical protein, partial [Nostoc commune]|uniref:hypothetical protein n=1 Tax=Nostoc commune TaxID=1178 RepID=UPI001E29E1B8